ncbi:hypothetical protein M885DRAFT_544689 [Pelagophyceae sp. CCMP2097]|nr:hypothetical protein M885DRAFT_544689 [Pelagophyceae sp. CCMP2097]
MVFSRWITMRGLFWVRPPSHGLRRPLGGSTRLQAKGFDAEGPDGDEEQEHGDASEEREEVGDRRAVEAVGRRRALGALRRAALQLVGAPARLQEVDLAERRDAEHGVDGVEDFVERVLAADHSDAPRRGRRGRRHAARGAPAGDHAPRARRERGARRDQHAERGSGPHHRTRRAPGNGDAPEMLPRRKDALARFDSAAAGSGSGVGLAPVVTTFSAESR